MYRPHSVAAAFVALLVVTSACSSSDSPPSSEVAEVPEEVSTDAAEEVPTEVAEEVSTDVTVEASDNDAPAGSDATQQTAESASEDASKRLPERVGPRRETTGSVPHIQTDAVVVPDVDAELRRRAFLLPGVEDRPTVISLPGARGLWLSESLDLARGDVLGGNREMAHIHPDGSLHVWMTVELATQVDLAKWGELHPWVDRDGFWNGVVMIYTPETLDEVDITIGLLVDAYNFITGATVDPAELA